MKKARHQCWAARLVCEDGRIVERGTHTELLGLRGRYAQTWEWQEQSERRAQAATHLEDELATWPDSGGPGGQEPGSEPPARGPEVER